MISVVIPIYNRPDTLARALDSLVAQTNQNFEVLVCDDGSTEDVKSVALSYSDKLKLRYFWMKNSGGPAHPRNIGVANAEKEWISFLDSDDWWCPDRIETILPLLREDVDVLYHPLELRSKKTSWRKRTEGRFIIGNPLEDLMSQGNPIPNSAVVVRKSKLLKIGGLCEEKSMVAIEDFDAWLQLAHEDANFCFVDKRLGYYWVSDDSISVCSPNQIERQKTLFLRHQDKLCRMEKSAKWAVSYHEYVIGTIELNLGNPKAALAAFSKSNQLRFASQRWKRYFKMVAAFLLVVFQSLRIGKNSDC
ncbi:glycosyltransferase family 2 protein [Geobacter argillaceus]|uniref:Glycosyl transferase family 2 n=1 Tax=Geobacter argillaceus TaxID=345631 RepID=A0A562W7U3_9BACT|nr:glycosyltransferase family A protein [Geobacter argillaceus]TWJ26353.1 glycosyl transferase family 2 [Geobacter argillaceus]